VARDKRPQAHNQSSQERLARKGLSQEQPFVGRESELQQLQGAFEAVADSGDGRLIMLVGEPGIGKTALCEQLSSSVSTRRGRTLVGHCYPEGSAGVPYQPFVEAFEAFARQHDADALRAELGPNASEVARMVPVLRSRLQVELSAPENPEDDRLRLLSGILDCLRNIGTAQPLLLVLEDLHDADRGTLDLLVYLARHLAGTPLLVVGTYRDVEVDRTHPLAAALAELRRGSRFERMHLGELSVDEVQRLLASSSQQAVPRALAEHVHHRSGGNALFVHELLRFLIGEGLVERRDGALHKVREEASLVGEMPEGLRDVVGKRLSRLSLAATQVLHVASIIGREFQLEVLRRVHPRPEEELENALAEAVAEAIVDEHLVVGATITYRFRHAFFQQTLADEIMAPQRIRLHQQVAHVLEEVHSRRLEEHATELAEHYSFSSDASDLSKAVEYAALAAKRATDVFAYGEASRQLERALAVQDLVNPDDRVRRLDLLLALGAVLFPSGDTERAVTQVGPEAFALAEKLGDRSRAFRACRLVLDCLFSQSAGAGQSRGSTDAQPAYLVWAERARHYSDPDSIERVHTDLAFAHELHMGGQYAEAHALRLQALALARQHSDPEALFNCAILLPQGAPKRWEERVRLAKECAGWPRQGLSSQTLGYALWLCGLVLLSEGERAQAEDLFRQLAELAQHTRVATVGLSAAGSDAILAIIDGHLDDALELIRRYIERADEAGVPIRGRNFAARALLPPALYLGRADIWLSMFGEPAARTTLTGQGLQLFSRAAQRAICLAQLGRLEEARAVVGPILNDLDGGTIDDESLIVALINLLQAAIAVEHKAAAQALAAHLTCVSHLTGEAAFRTCVARHLGDAAALTGDHTAARAYYLQALEAAGRIRFRPELALTHLRLAELLVEGGDDHAQSEALEHLDVAIPELQDMHMQPGLERGLALRVKLTPDATQEPARQSASDTLTAREREIASLVADGLSNRDIAEKLVISEGTVEVHVKHILGKLSFSSRAQVAGWFARQGPG
jgi:DNA-binding CsgD family transcriptional regulator